MGSYQHSRLTPNPKATNPKRGRPRGSTHQCSKPKALRGVKARRMELTPSLHDTETECQLYLNDADILSCNTTSRNVRDSNQYNDHTFLMNMASAKGCNTEPNDNSNANISHITNPQAYSWATNNVIDTHPILPTKFNHHNTPSNSPEPLRKGWLALISGKRTR